ncbi:uncharacterized protein PSFLO_05643 [Pseudozyma flocculosa]|uniref:Uncharacterized protein n=1 Tax=Pseudozyma flocculosa TaxID=84751 RepID=A0A5C3F9U0_9BASI|nr:uncharacterized protein PSFLO_05643 [Pseudozyma flocculosa]
MVVWKSWASCEGQITLSTPIKAASGDAGRMMLQKHLKANQDLYRKAANWSDASLEEFQMERWLWDNFQEYSGTVYKAPLGDITFDIKGVDELFDRCTHFLMFILKETPGRFGEKYLCANTFRGWAVVLLYVIITELRSIDCLAGVLISGWQSNGKDNLFWCVMHWVRATAADKKLSRKAPKRRHYGKWEASLNIQGILNRAILPFNFSSQGNKTKISTMMQMITKKVFVSFSNTDDPPFSLL